MAVKILDIRRFVDERGWFSETWNAAQFATLGIDLDFVQDNHSYSKHPGTIRGLHFQTEPYAQAKLVRCIRGAIFDVAVDIRKASPTYKQWVGAELSADNGKQLYVPRGFAHGFMTLTPETEVIYKVDSLYCVDADGGVAWNDPEIGVIWPSNVPPILSDKDKNLPTLDKLDADFTYDGIPLNQF